MKVRWYSLLAGALLCLTEVTAWAGDGGHAGGASQAQWILLGCAMINFALFIYLMRRFTGRPLADYLRARRERVREAIEAAARAKKEAEAMKVEYEAKSASLERTRAEMMEEMSAIAEADRAKTLAAVREAAERLLRDAERTAKSDLERAKRELRAEAAQLASGAASKEVGGRLDREDHRRLLNDFLKGVDRQP